MPRLRTFLLTAVLTSIPFASLAHASVLEFTSASAYSAASYPTALLYFDGQVDPSSFNQLPGATMSVADVTFTAPSANLYLMGPGVSGLSSATLYAQQGATALQPSDPGVVLDATFTSTSWPVTAVGTQIGGYGIPEQMTVTVTTNLSAYTHTYSAPDAYSSLGFLGFVSTTPGETISSISYSAPQTGNVASLASVVLDNFTYGSVNASGVPEPASLGILGAGALIAIARRRRVAGR